MTTPVRPHETGSTGLHVTSSKNDPDLTTIINYIMDSTETIKLATMLLSLSKFLEFWMDHNYVQNFEKLYFFQRWENKSNFSKINLFSEAFPSVRKTWKFASNFLSSVITTQYGLTHLLLCICHAKWVISSNPGNDTGAWCHCLIWRHDIWRQVTI